MKLLIVSIAFCILSTEALRDSYDIWYQWKHLYAKTYAGEQEDNDRRRQFDINLEIIAQHNLKHDVGLVPYSMRVNTFSDLSRDEFQEQYSCKSTRNVSLAYKNIVHNVMNINNTNPPSVDWREKGLVTSVKFQGHFCGSCWAFAAAGVVEGQYAKKFHTLREVSAQQLVDCSRDYGNQGCHGGFTKNAIDYIEDKGIEAEESYPYTMRDGQCKYNRTKVLADVYTYIGIAPNEDALQTAVAQNGPIAVAIDSRGDFNTYHDGIYESETCSREDLNHEALVVGYGTSDGNDYWIVKNSFGDTWGKNGYIYVARNKSNMCGIASDAYIAFV